MNDILNLVNSDNKEISAIAIMLLDLQKEYAAERISKEEYVEILEDIERTHAITEGATSIELKGTLLKGISVLLQIA
jgi:hypothetical protein